MGGTEYPTKQWRFDRIIDIVTFRRGNDWSLTELNKILAMTAFTITVMGYIPQLGDKHQGFIKLALPMAVVHWAYSMNKYFGFNIKRVLNSRGDMKVSLLCGMATMACFVLNYIGHIKAHHFMMVALLGSTFHYLFMKYSLHGGKLDLKPLEYLPLMIAGYAVFHQISSGNFKI